MLSSPFYCTNVLLLCFPSGGSERQRVDVSAPVAENGEAGASGAHRLRRAARELRGAPRDARPPPDERRLVQRADLPEPHARRTLPRREREPARSALAFLGTHQVPAGARRRRRVSAL